MAIREDYTDWKGDTYRAVHRDGCEGCAFFNSGPPVIARMFSEACYAAPDCAASRNGGKSIIWVKKGERDVIQG